MQTLKKSEMVASIHANLNEGNEDEVIAKQTVDRVLTAFSEELSKALAEGKLYRITDVGSLKPHFVKGRTGRNPKTGEPIDIPARVSVKFKQSDVLRKKLN